MSSKRNRQKVYFLPVFFFCDFRSLATKKKGLANPTKGFLRFLKTIRHIMTKNN